MRRGPARPSFSTVATPPRPQGMRYERKKRGSKPLHRWRGTNVPCSLRMQGTQQASKRKSINQKLLLPPQVHQDCGQLGEK